MLQEGWNHEGSKVVELLTGVEQVVDGVDILLLRSN